MTEQNRPGRDQSDESDPARKAWMLAVLDRYEGPLTRYAARLVGSVDGARDIVQETFLRLCSDKASQNGQPNSRHLDDEKVGPWLFAVCRNRALDVLRKDKSMKTMQANAISNVSGAAEPGGGQLPSSALERGEAVGQLHAVVASLPANQQEALRLRFQNEMSYQQIGEVMQTSVGNVGYLLHHAIKTVREKMGINIA